ncbi:MAG: DUF433 domain-containing protein [Pyrinomonadaceae bacterium]
MKKRYVEKREGGYWVADTRVSLDSLVYAFNRGESPESIRSAFSVLTLEEVYGALTYYLANQELIDKYLVESEIEFDKQAKIMNEEFRKAKPELYARLKNAEVIAR